MWQFDISKAFNNYVCMTYIFYKLLFRLHMYFKIAYHLPFKVAKLFLTFFSVVPKIFKVILLEHVELDLGCKYLLWLAKTNHHTMKDRRIAT